MPEILLTWFVCAHAEETWATELLSLMEEFQVVACIRGYHVFKGIWEWAFGEQSMCEWESHQQRDHYVKCLLYINFHALHFMAVLPHKNILTTKIFQITVLPCFLINVVFTHSTDEGQRLAIFSIASPLRYNNIYGYFGSIVQKDMWKVL